MESLSLGLHIGFPRSHQEKWPPENEVPLKGPPWLAHLGQLLLDLSAPPHLPPDTVQRPGWSPSLSPRCYLPFSPHAHSLPPGPAEPQAPSQPGGRHRQGRIPRTFQGHSQCWAVKGGRLGGRGAFSPEIGLSHGRSSADRGGGGHSSCRRLCPLCHHG